MRLKKLTSWSGTRGSKEKRQVEKEKNAKVRQSDSPSNLSLHSSPIRSWRLSPRFGSALTEGKGTTPTKEDVAVSKTTTTMTTVATTNPGILSKQEDDRPCLLFEDVEDEDDEDVRRASNVNNVGKDQVNNSVVKDQKITTTEKLLRGTTTPSSKPKHRSLTISTTPKNLFLPPQEIRIDPLAVPPSPMREPNVNIMASPSMNKRLLDDYHPGMYLNLNNEPSPRTPCLGDPVGDIAMQRQLMDAQRLVRIVLGKSLKGDHNFLEPNTILQAIRSYALMKAELMDLRKKQEIADGDPPAILQALGSPAATTPSKTVASACSPRKSDPNSSAIGNDCYGYGSTKHGHESHIVGGTATANHDAPIPRGSDSGLVHSKEMIERLQNELKNANETILELKKKIQTKEEKEEKKNTTCIMNRLSSNTVEIQNENDKEQPIQSHQQNDGLIREESNQRANEDTILNDVTHSPQRVLTKDVVPQILNSDCHLHTKKSQTLVGEDEIRQSQEESDQQVQEPENGAQLQDEKQRKQNQAIIMDDENMVDTTTAKREEEIRQSQEGADQQVQETENGVKLQDENQKKQNQAVIMDKEHILDATTANNKNNTTILMEVSHNTANNNNNNLSSSSSASNVHQG